MEKRDYRGLLGSLIYLVQTCRPDIANAVHALRSFLNWQSKIQSNVATSTAEAEDNACVTAVS